MSRLPLELVEAFVEVSRRRNMTRAAEAMHLTVSALSHRIRQLEVRLSQRLLLRGPRGVQLTDDGQRLFDAVAAPLDDIERALARPARNNRVAISLLPLMASGWLLPRMTDFVTQNPDVSFDLQCSAHMVDFEREAVDFALRLGRGGWPGVHAERMFDEWIAPVACAELGLHQQPLQPDCLDGLPLLGDPSDWWTGWFAAFGGRPPARYVAHVGDAQTLHQAAVQGLGVALARLRLAEPLIRSGRLRRITREKLSADYSYFLVYPERSRRLPAFARVREWILGQAAESAVAPD